MERLATIMFLKALIVGLWAIWQEYREARYGDASIGAILYEEWCRRTAKQPLALTDRRPNGLN